VKECCEESEKKKICYYLAFFVPGMKVARASDTSPMCWMLGSSFVC